MLKKIAADMVYGQQGEQFCRSFKLINALYWRIPVTITWDAGRGKYRVRDISDTAASGTEVFISHPRRVHNFYRGIAKRFRILEQQYFFDRIPVDANDTVIDCGANIGEVGMYFADRGVPVRYIAVEPSKDEGDCLLLNNPAPQTHLIRKALWKEETVLSFYSKSDTADNSVFEIDEFSTRQDVPATTLASIMQEQKLDRVKLLKLEAEGAEPEILEGIGDRLSDIHYITADCGFERGKDQDHTVAQVSNMLIGNGFEMIDMSFDRIVCLYRNRRSKA